MIYKVFIYLALGKGHKSGRRREKMAHGFIPSSASTDV